MLITIIGGSGFVGTRLIPEIGMDQCCNVDKKMSSKYDNITTLGDIREKDIVNKISELTDTVVLLAAEHRDDVTPSSLYYDVNVEGTRNVLHAMGIKKITNIIFTSSVAVYGLNKINPDEEYSVDPFNHYGKSKYKAEEVLSNWYKEDPEKRSVTIIRPTVIFGEANRGNVYNLLNQIATGRFMMIGDGKNMKSMAYVGNVVAFIKHAISIQKPGYRVYNYVDKPDFSMNELVSQVYKDLNRATTLIRIPQLIGMLGGYALDIVAKISGKKFPISSVRITKFCATTQFSAEKIKQTGFIPPFTIQEGLRRTLQYEFLDNHSNETLYYTE